MTSGAGVLEGVRVIEFDAIGPVPWCGRLLAGMGAEVVRIGRPGGEAPEADSDFMKGGRTVVNIDLKESDGAQAALSLIAKADVLLEGLRPGAMERLGLGPKDCLAVNKALIYARMTGWGQEGPLSKRAGHDINYIALTGALHAIGPSERPVLPLNLVGDYGGGGAFLVMGMLGALLRSRRTGHGEVVDVAMVDGAASLMGPCYSKMAMSRWTDQRSQNMLDGGAPWYDVYETKDGKFMAVGAIEPQFYSELLAGLGFTEASFPSRADKANWPEIRARFTQAFLTRARDEWATIFDPLDACVSPVLSLEEAPLHPHNVARGTFAPWEGHPVPAPAPRFGETVATHAGRSQSSSVTQVLQQWENHESHRLPGIHGG